jgi:lysine biosynthesis protein LysW
MSFPQADSARSAPCPLCRHLITIADFDIDRGEIFGCSACGGELQLLGFNPLRLARAEPVEEEDA